MECVGPIYSSKRYLDRLHFDVERQLFFIVSKTIGSPHQSYSSHQMSACSSRVLARVHAVTCEVYLLLHLSAICNMLLTNYSAQEQAVILFLSAHCGLVRINAAQHETACRQIWHAWRAGVGSLAPPPGAAHAHAVWLLPKLCALTAGRQATTPAMWRTPSLQTTPKHVRRPTRYSQNGYYRRASIATDSAGWKRRMTAKTLLPSCTLDTRWRQRPCGLGCHRQTCFYSRRLLSGLSTRTSSSFWLRSWGTSLDTTQVG